jgi:hypothetical protein
MMNLLILPLVMPPPLMARQVARIQMRAQFKINNVMTGHIVAKKYVILANHAV